MAALTSFHPATAEWFGAAFDKPTPAQAGAWDAIARGKHALVVAPTGSGKTLAAFLSAIDRLLHAPEPERAHRTRVLYVSPLKALAVDVERNLRAPLIGVSQTAQRLGETTREVTVGVRTGDTPPAERRRLVSSPPDILITTAESLYLMLTSAARESLRGVDTVILDEVHAVAGTKRGAHLAISLERLDALLTAPARRVGLSATVRPHEEVARFLGGREPVEIVAPPAEKQWDLTVRVPVTDMTAPPGFVDPQAPTETDPGSPGAPDPGAGDSGGAASSGSIWPHVEAQVLDLIEAHETTLVFANSRRLAERLTARLNELAASRAPDTADAAETQTSATQASGPPAEQMAQAGQTHGADPVIARAHHGSVSKEQRAAIEEDLKTGRLPCVVATSSLELGIDMGSVDLVVQVESPPSVASALQRIGRAGHQVGATSRGVLFPKHRGDLAAATVAVRDMRAGRIESLRVPTNPLDVLAQQIIAICAIDSIHVDELYALLTRAAPFTSLPRSAYEAVLDLLSGRYPSEDFAELRPRVVWDRVTGQLTGRPGAQRLAVTSGGTIPDRGLFAVFLVSGEGPGRRVGELDEEMVYESRVGDVFALGASSWRIEEITHDRVLVSPAPGVPGKLPFWTGETLGRPLELGRAIGALGRELLAADREAAHRLLEAEGLDENARDNLLTHLYDQREATGTLPTDQDLVVERCRDELGDWRIVLHSPYGRMVHAPWALALGTRLRERYGIDPQVLAADDGIVLRIPDTDKEPPSAADLVIEPEEIEALVRDATGGSALFASRFRECAARALLLPRRDPGKRSPLWQQRQRAAQLLEVAARHPAFPITLETMREVLQDVYDLPGLREILTRLRSREIRMHDVETSIPSPFARDLLFSYIASFVYEGDSPLAERRAAALTLDQGLLADLLGTTELREMLDPGVLEQVETELQRTAPERRATSAEALADLIRQIGPLPAADLAARVSAPDEVAEWTQGLLDQRRVVTVRVAGADQLAAVEDVARLRDGLGVPAPLGVPLSLTAPVEDPVGDLVLRHSRTHGPFTAAEVAQRFGLGEAVVRHTLTRLVGTGQVVQGEFRPTGQGTEWCGAEVLRLLRRRSLAQLRTEVEPVPTADLARLVGEWNHVTGKGLRGVDGTFEAIDQLAGLALPASVWETQVLPARVRDYTPAMLDELTSTGEVVWFGTGPLAGNDGWVALAPADRVELTLPLRDPADLLSAEAAAVAERLAGGAGWFGGQVEEACADLGLRGSALPDLIWELVWAGRLSNDTLGPLRTLVSGGTRRGAPRTTTRSASGRRRPVGRRAVGRRAVGRVGRPGASPAGPVAALGGGRWTLLPPPVEDPTLRASATAELLLERYAVLTRGAVQAEGVPGGFAGVYRVLSTFEEAGRCRRGHFVEGLGASQFATVGAVDRLRSHRSTTPLADDPADPQSAAATAEAVVLAATDPANPYGAALPWPDPVDGTGEASHRPARRAGSLVVLQEGRLVFYLERGGRTLLSFSEVPEAATRAAEALVGWTRRTRGRLLIEKLDGSPALGQQSTTRTALDEAGFTSTPRGLLLRP